MKTKIFTGLIIVFILSLLLTAIYSCKKDESEDNDNNKTEEQEEKEVADLSNITDGDGNKYDYIEIGEQIWLSENLKTTKYNDGTPIPEITENSEWQSHSAAAFCWYDNNYEDYGQHYGALYNFTAASSGKLCPRGWRVPTDKDWANLINYLDNNSNPDHWTESYFAGSAIKSTRTQNEYDHPRWSFPNIDATNSSEFSGLPGGYRTTGGAFHFLGFYAYWWTSCISEDDNPWYRYVTTNYSIFFRFDEENAGGLSVRCIANTL